MSDIKMHLVLPLELHLPRELTREEFEAFSRLVKKHADKLHKAARKVKQGAYVVIKCREGHI